MQEKRLKHHLLITGTGRAGTTFLMNILTRLDLDTGFTKEYLPAKPTSTGGLEYQGLGGDLPYVLKNPKLIWQLPELLKENPSVVIDHILLPIREIHAAAESRRRNVAAAPPTDDPRKVIGGLEGVTDPAQQEAFFLEKLYDFFLFASAYHIPLTLLHYPRLVLDGPYLYHKLRPLLTGISQERFLEVFHATSDLTLVNQYTTDDVFVPAYDDSFNLSRQSAAETAVGGDLLQLRSELQRLRADYLFRDKEHAAARARARELEEKAARMEIAISQYREELYGVYTSRSWRWTKPLRKAGAILRRLGRLAYRPRLRAVIKRIYFLLPGFVRRCGFVEDLKAGFKRSEMTVE